MMNDYQTPERKALPARVHNMAFHKMAEFAQYRTQQQSNASAKQVQGDIQQMFNTLLPHTPILSEEAIP